jgi:CRP-like cAMP-binding protein
MSTDRIEVLVRELKTLPLFQELIEDEIRSLVSSSQVIRYTKESPIIFREGDPADGLYIILRGEVEILKFDSTGVEYLLSVLPAGDFMGERTLLAQGKRGAMARVKSDSLVLFLSGDDYLQLMNTAPAVLAKLLLRMLATTSDRLRLLSEHYVLTKGCLERLKSF